MGINHRQTVAARPGEQETGDVQRREEENESCNQTLLWLSNAHYQIILQTRAGDQ